MPTGDDVRQIIGFCQHHKRALCIKAKPTLDRLRYFQGIEGMNWRAMCYGKHAHRRRIAVAQQHKHYRARPILDTFIPTRPRLSLP